MKDIRWVAFQPLIGGMAIAAENAFKSSPTAVISYDEVANDDLYLDYMTNVKKKNIKHFVLDGTLYSLADTFKEDKGSWEAKELKNIDVVIAVPICAGLSSANTHSSKDSEFGRGSDAKQNNNMRSILESSLKHIKPKVFIFENAYKLATPLGKDFYEVLKNIANENGYSTTLVKVNTLNHGIPQNRTRTFFYAWRDAKNAIELKFEPVNPPTVLDIIKGAPASRVLNPSINENNGWIKYAKSVYGEDFKKAWIEKSYGSLDTLLSIRNDFDYAKQFFDERGQRNLEYYKSKKAMGKGWMSDSPIYQGDDKMCSLYGRSMIRIVHPTEMRGFTVREIMRMMGLPDDFPEPEKTFMIGQNVPVCTAQYYCNQIVKYFNGELKESNERDLMQNFCSIKKQNKIPSGFANFQPS